LDSSIGSVQEETDEILMSGRGCSWFDIKPDDRIKNISGYDGGLVYAKIFRVRRAATLTSVADRREGRTRSEPDPLPVVVTVDGIVAVFTVDSAVLADSTYANMQMMTTNKRTIADFILWVDIRRLSALNVTILFDCISFSSLFQSRVL